MTSELTLYITRYGYLAVFLLVLLQELGMPNPVTNELVLLFSGYLAFSGVLNLWLVFLTAVSADCIGTTILYLRSTHSGHTSWITVRDGSRSPRGTSTVLGV